MLRSASVLILLAVMVQMSSALFNISTYSRVNLKFYYGSTARTFTQYQMSNITQILSHKYFDNDRITAMFVFGWIQAPHGDTSRQLIDAYIHRGDHNFLVLDWSDYSVGLYTPVLVKVSQISRIMGRVLVKLFRKGLNDKHFHCVGHSFGAHSCGIIGREVITASNRQFKFGRITGLDPARPKFFPPIYENPLNVKDARFVDTMHTENFWVGTDYPLGHVSFIPNGANLQPGCPKVSLLGLFNIISNFCSHYTAVRYYTDTLYNPSLFPARKCPSWYEYKRGACNNNAVNYMGFAASPNVRGVFYVKFDTNLNYDGIEIFNFIMSRVSWLLGDILRLDFHLL